MPERSLAILCRLGPQRYKLATLQSQFGGAEVYEKTSQILMHVAMLMGAICPPDTYYTWIFYGTLISL